MTALQAKTDVEYTLLSDAKLDLAGGLGIVFDASDLPDGYRKVITGASGQERAALPVPSVFIVDKKGKIGFAYVNPDYKRRIPPSVLLAAAREEAKD